MADLQFEWDEAKADRADRIRIISAREASRREPREYEEHS